MPENDPVPILTALIEVTEVQLTEAWAEVRDQNTYSLAIAGLAVAIIGIIVAVQKPLGADWWVPIPGLAVTVVAALLATTGVATSLGPSATSFLDAFGESPASDSLAHLLADLVATLQEVPATLRKQRVRLLWVFAVIAVTAIYSTLVLI